MLYLFLTTILWMIHSQSPTSSPPQGNFVYIKSGTCESNGFASIHTVEICKAAAVEKGKNGRFIVRAGNWNDGRPTGCSYHRVGNIELWKSSSGDCTVNGYDGCFCKIIDSPIQSTTQSPPKGPQDSDQVMLYQTGVLDDEDLFNEYWNTGSIICRSCSSCTATHKLICYTRITKPTRAAINGYILFTTDWFKDGNMLHEDFELYSSFEDAKSGRNQWSYCNYDDPGIGFPRDCGPQGSVQFQWNSRRRRGHSVKYWTILSTELPPPDPSSIPSPTSSPTSSSPQGNFVYIKSGTCESNGFASIHTVEICKAAAVEKGKNGEVIVRGGNWNNGRPTGCSYRRFGKIELWESSSGDCTVNGYDGCFCKIIDSPTQSPLQGPQDSDQVILYQTDVLDDEDLFNEYWNTGSIICRSCSSCTATHKLICYKRITQPTRAAINGYILFTTDWFKDGNVLHEDFELYSSFEDAMSGHNQWSYCNYDDPGIGFPRDCGPQGYVQFQWNSRTRRGHLVKYWTMSTSSPTSSPIVSTELPAPDPLSTPSPTSSPTSSSPHENFVYIKSGTCESNGFASIHTVEICKAAAVEKGKNGEVIVRAGNWNNGRPTGCSYHRFGNIELWESSSGDCTVNDYDGCFCKIIDSPLQSPASSPASLPTSSLTPSLFPTITPTVVEIIHTTLKTEINKQMSPSQSKVLAEIFKNAFLTSLTTEDDIPFDGKVVVTIHQNQRLRRRHLLQKWEITINVEITSKMIEIESNDETHESDLFQKVSVLTESLTNNEENSAFLQIINEEAKKRNIAQISAIDVAVKPVRTISKVTTWPTIRPIVMNSPTTSTTESNPTSAPIETDLWLGGATHMFSCINLIFGLFLFPAILL